MCVFEDVCHIGVHVAMDSVLCVADVHAVAHARAALIDDELIDEGECAQTCSKRWSPVLVLIPLRLGLTGFISEYKPAVHVCCIHSCIVA